SGMFVGAVREAAELQRITKRIAVDARRPGEKLADTAALRHGFEQTAIATPGLKAQDVAAGVGAFRERSGSLDLAVKFQDVIAKTSLATGIAAETIGAAAGRMSREMKITNVKDMRDALAAISARAKDGGLDFNQAAAQLTTLSA